MILDTNALSALAAKDTRLQQKIAPATHIAVTLISLGEYEFGLLNSSYRTELEAWLSSLLTKIDLIQPNRQTLPYYAAIRHELKVAGNPIPANDVWIAALVRQHNMPLLSRDRHFDAVDGIDRVEW
ncbi:MAG TPA: PIN domain-containing protein [Opitutales bacterium]|nr:PIN domain-containing protein [Opitutales bacterium]